MSDELLIRHCSPTLAGKKTGNLFMYSPGQDEDIRDTIRSLNRRLRDKGLRIIPLKILNGKVMLYIYRPERLKNDLADNEASTILAPFGYDCAEPNFCLARLIQRLKAQGEFPHEIGLFLGYPPEDVAGFIENKAEGSKLVGTWKVYGDVRKAEQIFRDYSRCTDTYLRLWSQGCSVETLAVSSAV